MWRTRSSAQNSRRITSGCTGRTIRHIHLSDYNRMAPGDSGYDFTEMMQALKDISFDGYLTMEAAFTKRSEQPFTAARRAIEYLRGIEATLR